MKLRMNPGIAGVSLAFSIALLVPSVEGRAAGEPAGPPQAGDVLQQMSDFLGKTSAFSYHAEIEFDQILPGGPKVRLSGAADVAVVRPGNLAIDYRDDVSDRIIWFDQGVLTLFDPVASTWAQVDGPKDIDAMIAKLETELGLTLPLAELAESDSHAALTRGTEVAHYIGIHNVEGIHCHHIVLQRPDLDLQVFVEVGDKPLPRKLVFEYPKRPGSPQFTASITEWTLETPNTDTFKAKVPKDAAKVEFLPIAEAR